MTTFYVVDANALCLSLLISFLNCVCIGVMMFLNECRNQITKLPTMWQYTMHGSKPRATENCAHFGFELLHKSGWNTKTTRKWCVVVVVLSLCLLCGLISIGMNMKCINRFTELPKLKQFKNARKEKERGEHLRSPAMELHLTFDIPKTRCLPTEFCALILSQYCISVKTNCFFAAFIIYVHKFVLRRCSRCVINVSNVHHLYCWLFLSWSFVIVIANNAIFKNI